MKKRMLVRRVAVLGVLSGAMGLGLAPVPAAHGLDAIESPVPVPQPIETIVAGKSDLTVALVSRPALASPGADVLLEATVSQGSIPTGGTLTVTLPSGFAYDDAASTDSCSGAGTVTCPIPAEATVAPFNIVVAASSTEGSYTTTATVASDLSPTGLIEYPLNNSSSTTTTVASEGSGVTAGPIFSGIIFEGGAGSISLPDGRKFTLFVPEGAATGEGNGIIVTIAGDSGNQDNAPSGPARQCGTAGDCGPGFSVVFDEGSGAFEARNPLIPLEADFTFGGQDPCHGLGSEKCLLWPYYATSVTANVLDKVSRCAGSTGGDTPGGGDLTVENPAGSGRYDPCVNQRYKSSDNEIFFDLRLLSNDPLIDPPKNLGLGG